MSSSARRPRRAAAVAARKQLSDIEVAEVVDVHATKSIALTAADVLESAAARDKVFCDMQTTVVTLHTNLRPKGMPRGTHHVAAEFADTMTFDDQTLSAHLDDMSSRIEGMDTARVVFVCQAGINRSSLALCWYCHTRGQSSSWQAVKAAIARAKRGAASGWPTLVNAAFEAFLSRHLDHGASGSKKRVRDTVDDQEQKEPSRVRWFWRTVVTARPSTGGPDTDPKVAEAKLHEWAVQLRQKGIDPQTGKTYGCWAGGKVGGQWIRGVPNESRPWEG